MLTFLYCLDLNIRYTRKLIALILIQSTINGVNLQLNWWSFYLLVVQIWAFCARGVRGRICMSDFFCSLYCSPIVLKFNGTITSNETWIEKITLTYCVKKCYVIYYPLKFNYLQLKMCFMTLLYSLSLDLLILYLFSLKYIDFMLLCRIDISGCHSLATCLYDCTYISFFHTLFADKSFFCSVQLHDLVWKCPLLDPEGECDCVLLFNQIHLEYTAIKSHSWMSSVVSYLVISCS